MDRRGFLIENLAKYATLAELHRSGFFAECREELASLLATPEIYHSPCAVPRIRSFLRVVQWNIEKGTRYPEILETLRWNEILRWADVILLNEADCGMIRSGNRHVSRDLADALGMNMVFYPAHLELTKGTGEDLLIEGSNVESLQGNAVLSRYPILEARLVPLPVCFEPYEFHEKRYGRRNCVWARLQTASRTLWLGSCHLEVRNTPRCRAHQMSCIMENLPGCHQDGYILGGDFNANGFARGTRWRTLNSLLRLVIRPSAKIKERLRHPERGSELLFERARKAGFSWDALNSEDETAWAELGGLEDAALLPDMLARMVGNRLKPYGGYLLFKLDWLLGRNVRALKDGELQDAESGLTSRRPGCVACEVSGPRRFSDHRPIFADVAL